ncbi:NAD-dependent epimerase/dehydratase family protein [Yoonia sp. SS1-5]|uniref:NAD-dependent epimerase/dehydratase family protein n=1 Tax=Yoonia rhodophyticola TaxID=3137370 RepID=A0AAN0M857_9RHOB
MTRRILITGATGFVGRALCKSLRDEGHKLRLYCRKPLVTVHEADEIFEGPDLGEGPMPLAALDGVGCIIHLAARVTKAKPNADIANATTVRIARHVAAAIADSETRDVLLLSSIAAQHAQRHPEDARPYGVEKLAAEGVFQDILPAGKNLVILRPPAVYGPGMSGALAILSKFVDKGLPIPLGLAKTKRPYIARDTLTDLMVKIASADAAQWSALAAKPLCCCDPDHIDTASLVRLMAQMKGRPSRLVPVPLGLLRAFGRVTGKSELVSGALDAVACENSAELQSVLGWAPRQGMPETLAFLRSAT